MCCRYLYIQCAGTHVTPLLDSVTDAEQDEPHVTLGLPDYRTRHFYTTDNSRIHSIYDMWREDSSPLPE